MLNIAFTVISTYHSKMFEYGNLSAFCMHICMWHGMAWLNSRIIDEIQWKTRASHSLPMHFIMSVSIRLKLLLDFGNQVEIDVLKICHTRLWIFWSLIKAIENFYLRIFLKLTYSYWRARAHVMRFSNFQQHSKLYTL